MQINVVWKSYHKETPNRGYWDMAMLERMFQGLVWPSHPDVRFNMHDGFETVPSLEGAIVIMPSAYHAGDIDEINRNISMLPWVLFIVAGDENGFFPSHLLKHPNMKIWLMTPHIEKDLRNIDRFIGEGPAPDAYNFIPQYKDEAALRPFDWSFSGQVTHARREEMYDAVKNLKNGYLNRTSGFTQGLSHPEYYKVMAQSKVVLCPSGPGTVDSFRFFEALEAGCVPIADTRTPSQDVALPYWNYLFGEHPFPTIENWAEVKDLIQYHVDVWPESANKIFAWWQNYKREFVYNLFSDINELDGFVRYTNKPEDFVTVLIPTSPIPSHPSTGIIEETISTIRHHLPKAEIIIMIDGVREEQKDRKADYEEYKRRLLWKCNHEWEGVLPVVFDEHKHQAEMTKQTLKKVRTPLILFVEHDTPLTPDNEIDWAALCDIIAMRHANMIRFHFEAHIPEVHKPLMLAAEPEIICGARLMPTSQWSQRPHLAATEFYKDILEKYFSHESRTMIEDKMHGILFNACEERQKAGWNEFKVYIYMPEGDIKRSYHLDGRGTDEKYSMRF